MAIAPDNLDPAIRNAITNAATSAATPTTAVVPGSAQDPFYHSTGQYKNVTLPDGTVVNALDVGSTKPPAATQIGMVSPSSGLTITGTERNMYNERQAMNIGYTAEYIASRGGINSQGYFNDTPLSGQLTADEMKSVMKPDGSVDTQKQVDILIKKQYDEYIAKGLPVEYVLGQLKNQWGSFYSTTLLPEEAQGLTPVTLGLGSSSGTAGTGAGAISAEEAEKRRREGQSAYNLLFEEFSRYGLGGLIEPLKGFIVEGLSPAEFTLRLRETDAYKKRFAANQARIAKGLRALSEAEYIQLEDQYQNVMRNYGLPASYYTRGDMGRQEGFEKFIAGDVSATELEDRIQIAQNRVINAAPEIAASLRAFYPDITNGDILAYALDPEKALTVIQRKVTAAEIGGAATMAGLTTGVARAEELGAFGVTGEQARQGFRAVAEVAPRGGQLAEFYRQTPYTQTTAEQEVFGLTGAAEAERQRKKLTQLEQAAFSGQAGTTGGALARDRAGAF